MNYFDSPQAGVLKRLFAMLYDALLVMALWLVASALLLPFSGDVKGEQYNPLITVYLLIVTYLFFHWFWTHGGQTLGMRAWKIKLVHVDSKAIDWKITLLRFVTGMPAWILIIIASLGVTGNELGVIELSSRTIFISGLVWLLIDNWPNSWRDRLSHTRVILLNQRPR
ncbi:MAG: RDD family protein [Gammaproteobacteria bacterium]|nr:RDD family protein [Gammaproteobacteria bacterium]